MDNDYTNGVKAAIEAASDKTSIAVYIHPRSRDERNAIVEALRNSGLFEIEEETGEWMWISFYPTEREAKKRVGPSVTVFLTHNV